jgi:hypothetical protein
MSNALSTLVVEFTPTVQTACAQAVVAAYALEDITDAPTCEAAVAVNAQLSKAVKAIGEERLAFTRKLDAVKKQAMEYEKHCTKEATECLTAIDAGINVFRAQIRMEADRREAEAHEAQLFQSKQETEAGEEYTTAPLVAVEPMLDVPKIPVRKVARVVIKNVDLIPRSYFALNESAVLASLRAGIEVPGAELVYEEVLVRR